MRKASLKIFIVALLLGVCGGVFFRLGALETSKDEFLTEVDFSLISGYYSPPWNKWDYAGGLSLLVAFSFAFAALMIWRRNRNEK